MRRSATEVIRNLERRIARLERSTMKKASNMPDYAESTLLDVIYDKRGLLFEKKEIEDLKAKLVYHPHIGSGTAHLVAVGELFAVVRCEMDEPGSSGCDVIEVTTSRISAERTFDSER